MRIPNQVKHTAICIFFAGLLLGACSATNDLGTTRVQSTPASLTPQGEEASETPANQAPTALPTPEPPFSGDGPWEITFTTTDGIALKGTLYGQGKDGVILGPTYPGGSAGWDSFAKAVAGQGYRVLIFDLRGLGKSEGTRSSKDATTDMTAAITIMQQEIGAERIVLIGAGIGGMAAIQAAPTQSSVVGVGVISSPRSFDGLELSDGDLASLTVPSLWLATRNDMTQNVEEMYNLASSSNKAIWIYEGSSLHGTFIFEGADEPDLTKRLLEFIVRLTE